MQLPPLGHENPPSVLRWQSSLQTASGHDLAPPGHIQTVSLEQSWLCAQAWSAIRAGEEPHAHSASAAAIRMHATAHMRGILPEVADRGDQAQDLLKHGVRR